MSALQVGCNGELKQQNAKLLTQVDTLNNKLVALREENASMRETLGSPLEVGFEVQVGAFEYFDLSAYTDELVRFQEVETNGMKKYVLGRFRHFEDAEAFLQDVQRMGVADAFIAGVVNGERATVAEAKEAAKDYYGDY
ncbi:MAG: hypothetical protein AAFV07_05315 [Bacteroidota bacterium]